MKRKARRRYSQEPEYDTVGGYEAEKPEYDTVGGYEAKKPEFQSTVRGYRAKKPEVLGTATANEAVPADRVWSRTGRWPLESARSQATVRPLSYHLVDRQLVSDPVRECESLHGSVQRRKCKIIS